MDVLEERVRACRRAGRSAIATSANADNSRLRRATEVQNDSAVDRPRLIFFHSSRSGRSRKAEGFLAQVLQHRRNHETFRLDKVAQEERPDLVERFRIAALPALVVIENNAVRGRLEGPRTCAEIRGFLGDWLR
jgi:thioredoxin-like negative regulator of GroEL